jgi:uncharacterized Zn finger protein
MKLDVEINCPDCASKMDYLNTHGRYIRFKCNKCGHFTEIWISTI